jgi:hypothetical protein
LLSFAHLDYVTRAEKKGQYVGIYGTEDNAKNQALLMDNFRLNYACASDIRSHRIWANE